MVYLLAYLFLALPTGILFLWVAFIPGTLPAIFGIETVPMLVRGIASFFGIVLTSATLWALRHGLRLQWIVRRDEPKPVRVKISVHESTDMTTYKATVQVIGSDATWQTPVYYNKAVDRLLDRSAKRVEAWIDPGNGAPIALQVDGRLVFTNPQATRTHKIVSP